MREFVCEQITPEELDAFSATHPQGNFQQTSRMGEVRKRTGVEVSYHGVREDGKLVAATILEIHRSRLSTFAEIHDGPLCDFHDRELTSFFFSQLKREARKGGAAQLSITTEQPYQIRDSFGRELPTDESTPWPANVPQSAPVGPDEEAFDAIVTCGFIHSGFDRTYNAVPRWRYVKDLTGIANEQALMATYAKNTRRDVKIADSCFVSVERIGRDDLPLFHDLCELSSKKQGFDNRPLEYFELLYDCLGDAAEFYVAFIDVASYLASCVEKRDSFRAKVDRVEQAIAKGADTDKNRRRLADYQEQYEGCLSRIEAAETYLAEDGERVPIAAALFVFHPRECIYLFSGSNSRYALFCAPNAIQHHIMATCVERGVTRYNFYGINGVFDDPADPGRGLLEFKQGFNGYVEEMMGSFTLPVKPAAYALKQLAHKVLGH